MEAEPRAELGAGPIDSPPTAHSQVIAASPSTKKRNQVRETDRKNREHGKGTVYRRGNIWWIEYRLNGELFRESSQSRKYRDASNLLDERKGQIARNEFAGPKGEKILVGTLLDLVVSDYQTRDNRSSDTLQFRLAHLRESFKETRAVDLDASVLDNFKQKLLDKGLSKATINRSLAALRRAYKLAVENRLIAPNRVPIIRLYREPCPRQGFLAVEDCRDLLGHLETPVDDITWFAFHSGWRRNEIVTLIWKDVDMDHRVACLRPEMSKNRGPRKLHLVGELWTLMQRRWAARLLEGKGGEVRVVDYVFHHNRKPVLDFRGAWDKAVKAIGQPHLIFHDLRRSAVRNMIQAGVTEAQAMRVSGHKTRSVFDRYNIVTDDDLRKALERTQAYLSRDAKPNLHSLASNTHSNGAQVGETNGAQHAN